MNWCYCMFICWDMSYFWIIFDWAVECMCSATSVALGGTHEKGNWSRTIDPTHRQRIWQGCCKLVPSLQVLVIYNHYTYCLLSIHIVRGLAGLFSHCFHVRSLLFIVDELSCSKPCEQEKETNHAHYGQVLWSCPH